MYGRYFFSLLLALLSSSIFAWEPGQPIRGTAEELAVAIDYNNTRLIRDILRLNPLLLETPYGNITPLQRAVSYGRIRASLALVWRGANIQQSSMVDGYSVLFVPSFREGRSTLFHEMVVDRGRRFDNLLMEQIRLGNIHTLPQDGRGLTPLHYATFVGNHPLVSLMIDRGLYQPSRHTYTLLHIAAMTTNLPLMRMLLRRYPMLLNVLDPRGETALDLASRVLSALHEGSDSMDESDLSEAESSLISGSNRLEAVRMLQRHGGLRHFGDDGQPLPGVYIVEEENELPILARSLPPVLRVPAPVATASAAQENDAPHSPKRVRDAKDGSQRPGKLRRILGSLNNVFSAFIVRDPAQ